MGQSTTAHIAPASGKARAGLAMSLATFAMAAGSGIQAVLYLSRFGTTRLTDGFFVAFAVYTTFGVFSQSLRLTSVPLLVQPGARIAVREFAAALVCIGLPVLVITVGLSHPVSSVLAPGLSRAGRSQTATGLAILGVAMTLQLWAAGGATVLAIRGRFNAVASAYTAGAGCGLLAYVALVAQAGVQILGWSMLVMALVTFTWLCVALRLSGGLGTERGSLRPGALARHAGLILGSTPAYLVFNMLFMVTLAFASHSKAGDSTMLSYAYLFASYLVAGTGMALGMCRIPDMTRTARSQRRAVVMDTVPQGYRYAMLVVTPALAIFVTVGAPLIHTLFPLSVKASGVGTLRAFGALLIPWTIGALLVNFLLPALFAANRALLLNLMALPLLAVHLLATGVGHALFGLYGAVGAFLVAPALFAAALMVAGTDSSPGPLARELARTTAAFLALSTLAFGIAWGLGVAVGRGFGGEALAILVGCGLYATGLRFVLPAELEVLGRALVARSRRAGAVPASNPASAYGGPGA